MTPSTRLAKVQQPLIPIVGDWIKQTPGSVSLAQGVVHYSPPASVFRAVSKSAADSDVSGYGSVCGRAALIAQARKKLREENGISGQLQQVVFTAGSNMGFLNAILAIADVGDEVILLSPYYFNHQMAIEIAGCTAVVVPTDGDYLIDLDAITSAITDRTRAIVTVSPNNPTGAVYSCEQLSNVNQLCKQRGIYHISDEAYEYFVYDNGPHFSPASLPDAVGHTISLFSFSKAYGMPGWRVGYMVIPELLESAVRKIQDTNLICPPMICQIAAAAAFDVGQQWCMDRIASLRSVRESVLDRLIPLGDRCHLSKPSGAFYMLLNLETNKDDMTLVHELIRDHGVATMPGSTFGIDSGCSLRVSYGGLSDENIAEGIRRLCHGLMQLL